MVSKNRFPSIPFGQHNPGGQLDGRLSSEEFEQDGDSLPGGHHASYDCAEAMEDTSRDLHVFSRL